MINANKVAVYNTLPAPIGSPDYISLTKSGTISVQWPEGLLPLMASQRQAFNALNQVTFIVHCLLYCVQHISFNMVLYIYFRVRIDLLDANP